MSDTIIKTAYDNSIYGGVDSNGSINEVWGKEAITNSLLMWLTSAKGDVLRNPSRGGILLPYLNKPMNEDLAQTMEDIIFIALESDFEPFLTVNYLTVTPNYEKRRWDIELEAYSPDYKTEVDLTTSINSLS